MDIPLRQKISFFLLYDNIGTMTQKDRGAVVVAAVAAKRRCRDYSGGWNHLAAMIPWVAYTVVDDFLVAEDIV